MDLRHVRTTRLALAAVVPADLDEHFALLSDPGTWTHPPSGRHSSPERTADDIAHSQRRWARDGRGYWTARLRADTDVPGLRPGQVGGTGGCAVREGSS